MSRSDDHKPAPPSACLPPPPEQQRYSKRRRPNTSPDTQNGGSIIEWSSGPPSLLRRAAEQYRGPATSHGNRDDIGQDLVTTSTPRPFQPELIRAKVTIVMESFPFEEDQGVYTAQHPLVRRVRSLISARAIGCTLCAFYEWGPIVDTHKLKRCSHRDEAGEARSWLEMFRRYRARGGGPGARCAHCRFPVMLCLRTVYREKMDLKYGSEREAREEHDFLYCEVQCTWVKIMQRFVTSCMVVHGSANDGGVSRLGGTVLEMMGWQDWRGLEENGPEHIRTWLEDMGEMRGLRCPRLLVLFWLLAESSSSEEQEAERLREDI